MSEDRNPLTMRQLLATRRRVLAGAGLAATLVALPGRVATEGRAAERPEGVRSLRAQAGQARLRGAAGAATDIWGYDGAVPGPVLRAKRGEPFALTLTNELGEATTLHWRGVRLANAMDGVPHLTQAPVAPAGRFECRFTPPDAGTFCYHPLDPRQRDRGLFGVLIVEEPEPPAADRDVLLVLQDWRLGRDGGRAEAADGGREHLTVNGAPSFDIAVKANERLRLRLVDASRVRPVAVVVERHRATVMAMDGQPAEPFTARDSRVVLGPGNRLDLMVDMTLAPGSVASLLVAGPDGPAPLARLVYDSGAAARKAPLPDPETTPLPANPLPARMDFRTALRPELPLAPGARPWTAAAAAAAGQYGPPLFTAKRGRAVVLALANRAPTAAAVHLHGHHARLLDNLDDGWKPFWLDTVVVAPQQTARLAFVADNPGKWLIEAQPLNPQEGGLCAWFEVT